MPATLEDQLGIVLDGFVGHTEAEIVKRYGPPSARWKGFINSPDWSVQQDYPDAVSAMYVRPKGILYLTFCMEQGRAVCFISTWLPEGWYSF